MFIYAPIYIPIYTRTDTYTHTHLYTYIQTLAYKYTYIAYNIMYMIYIYIDHISISYYKSYVITTNVYFHNIFMFNQMLYSI